MYPPPAVLSVEADLVCRRQNAEQLYAAALWNYDHGDYQHAQSQVDDACRDINGICQELTIRYQLHELASIISRAASEKLSLLNLVESHRVTCTQDCGVVLGRIKDIALRAGLRFTAAETKLFY